MVNMSNQLAPVAAASIIATLRSLAADEELTPEEAAREADVTRQSIYMWLRRKDDPLPARKKGRRFWLIRRGDLARYMARNTAAGGDDLLAQLSALPGFSHLVPDALRLTLRAWDWLRAFKRMNAASATSDLALATAAYAETEQARQALAAAIEQLDEQAMEILRAALNPPVL